MPEEESKPEIQMNFEGPVGTAIGKIVHQPPKPLPVGIPQNLPRTDAKEFVGRDEVMERLHEQLQRTERVAITSVTGMGGIGKTELALQYARRFLEKAYPGGACWLEGRGVDVAVQFLSFAKSRLDLNPSEELKRCSF